MLAIVIKSSAPSSRRAVVAGGSGNSSDEITSTMSVENPLVKMSSLEEEEEEEERDAVVEYIEVPSGEVGVMRYAANLRRGSTTTAISIRYWMTLVASPSSSSPSSSIGTKASRDLSKLIASSPYSSLLFEVPGTTWDKSDVTRFEFALVDAPELDAFVDRNGPDQDAFKEHFESSSCDRGTSSVCAFANLGGDATLVSPLPLGEVTNDATYSHLARFIRGAPGNQIMEFWSVASSTYLDVLRRKGMRRNDGLVSWTWFSSSGMGVAWLHLRIDDRPKYYSYVPFKTLR